MEMLHVFMSMSGMTLTTVISAHIVAVAAAFLIFHEKYEDGLIGRIALVMLLLAAIAFVVDGWSGDLDEVLPATALASVSFALFLVRHTYRFLQWTNSGQHSWDKSKT